MPHELPAFELKRGRQRLKLGSEQLSKDRGRARDLASDFGPSTKLVLECVPLVLGSFKAALELLKGLREARDNRRTLKQDEVKQKWQDELIREGLPERASEIASTFSADLTRLLESA